MIFPKGPEYTSTLDTVNNLGKIAEAEEIYPNVSSSLIAAAPVGGLGLGLGLGTSAASFSRESKLDFVLLTSASSDVRYFRSLSVLDKS